MVHLAAVLLFFPGGLAMNTLQAPSSGGSSHPLDRLAHAAGKLLLWLFLLLAILGF
ncbi:MAG: hypothetical protein AAGI71_10955 [Bacteroidota bacterium]